MFSRTGIATWAAIALTSSLALAEETAKLPDGRSVLLKDDGTYRILSKQVAAPAADGRTYRTIDMPDLKVDLKQIIGQNIRVEAIASVIGDILILRDPAIEFDANGIMVDVKELPRETRRWIVSSCSEQCRVTVEGEVIANAGLGPGILARNLKGR